MNDVYSVSARIENSIAKANLDLSPYGRILCNSYSLVLKDLYDFADCLPKQDSDNLRKILTEKEKFPLYVIDLCTPKEEE